MLNVRMSDTSRYISYTFVTSYASCPVQLTSKYLLVVVFVAKQSRICCNCCFAIKKFKIRLKMTYYLGKSTGSICNVSDFGRTIFESVSGSCLKDLAGNYIESKNVCKVKLSHILFM